MTPIIFPVDQREPEQEVDKPQHWRQLRWPHIWPVIAALIPLLVALALGMAAASAH